MLSLAARRFSRLSIPRTRPRDLQNLINVTEEVKFHRRSDPPRYADPHERESLEIERVYRSKFISRGRKNAVTGREEAFKGLGAYRSDGAEPLETTLGDSKDAFKAARERLDEDLSFNFREEPDEFLEFEKFESLKRNPRYQDLTHEERQSLQELQLRSRLRDPFNKLNTNRAKVDPEREERAESAIECVGEDEESQLLDRRLVEQNRFDEVVSRIRHKIRMEKKQSSEVAKLRIPSVDGVVVDPIRKHVLRRAARIGTMLHTHIEQLFTCNKPEFLHKYLNGATISINHVEMPTSKSTVKCYYNVLSKHDPSQVQRSLDLLAPRVRFLIARKLELGYTPPVRFIKYNRSEFAAVRSRAERLEAAFNLTLEGTRKSEPKGLLGEGVCEGSGDAVVIRDDQITPEMNREMQESFHRLFCGYP